MVLEREQDGVGQKLGVRGGGPRVLDSHPFEIWLEYDGRIGFY